MFIAIIFMASLEVFAEPTTGPMDTIRLDRYLLTLDLLEPKYGQTVLPPRLSNTDSLSAGTDATLAEVTVPLTHKDMLELDLTKPCGLSKEVYLNYLPEIYHDLVPSIVDMDKAGINGAWIAAIVVTEVGWTNKVMAKHNYFNWTVDTITYQSFETAEACMAYAKDSFLNRYFSQDWHLKRRSCKLEDGGVITIERVNEHYAINADGTVNWRWSTVVSDLMVDIYNTQV